MHHKQCGIFIVIHLPLFHVHCLVSIFFFIIPNLILSTSDFLFKKFLNYSYNSCDIKINKNILFIDLKMFLKNYFLTWKQNLVLEIEKITLTTAGSKGLKRTLQKYSNIFMKCIMSFLIQYLII